MNIFKVNSPEQQIAIDIIKNNGDEVIQVSNGLLVKTSKSKIELQKLLEGSKVEEFNRNDPDLSKDAKVFAGIKN